jgi:hypothetical protein
VPVRVEARRWWRRPLERKKAAPVGARAHEWRRWWWPLEPQAAPLIGVQFRRRWRRSSMQTMTSQVDGQARS